MTNSPQSIAEALARKCARNLLLRNGLGSDEKDVELILQSIPLVELLGLSEQVEKYLMFVPLEGCKRLHIEYRQSLHILTNLTTKLRELKVIE